MGLPGAWSARYVLLSAWAFNVLGNLQNYAYMPYSKATPTAMTYGYIRYCSSNDQCPTNECCKPFSGVYYACAPIGYDPRQCLASPSPPPTNNYYYCSKDQDCPGGCCSNNDANPWTWGTCRYDALSCRKTPTTCASSRECGVGGCCAYDYNLRNYYCVSTGRRVARSSVAPPSGRAIVFPQTKYPPYPPPQSTTKYPPYPPYPTAPPPTKYPPYPPYPTAPPPTKYPPPPPYPYPPPTKYPPYIPPPPPPPPVVYPPPPPVIYPPPPPAPPTKYPPYPPPVVTKYPPYPTQPPTYCLP